MNKRMGVCFLLPLLVPAAYAASTGSAFYGDPPDERHPWAIHDANRPQPARVEPGTFSTPDKPGTPPSDAVVLFGGTEEDLGKWESAKNGGPAKWKPMDGVLQCAPGTGDIRTKAKFGDCQLHVEWAAPTPPKGDSQGRGNSGIFLMGICEIQVLDNYDNPTYADGFACSIYGVNPPMANALHKPGEFQVVDIVFRRPVYKDGKPLDPGYVTIFCNGVLMQDHAALEGPTGHRARTKPGPFPEVGPLKLQDHGNTVRYRNIWYRPLPPNAIEGGTDGALAPEAALAKRHAIAAAIRADAAKIQDPAHPLTGLLRALESLVYEKDEATLKQTEQTVAPFVAEIESLPADKLAARKDDAKRLNSALQYLVRAKVIADEGAPATLAKLVKAQGWDKK